MEIRIHPRKLTVFLCSIILLLLAMHAVGLSLVFTGVREFPPKLFGFDQEFNLPTYFSSALFAMNALLAGVIACSERRNSRTGAYGWMGLALAFAFLSLDEAVMIHERIAKLIDKTFDVSGVFYFSWVIPYGILFLVLLIPYTRFFLRLPAGTRKQVFFAAFFLVGGGLGMEMLTAPWFEAHGHTRLYYILSTTEEMMEFIGATAFIYAFTSYIDTHLPDFRVRISST